MGTKITKGNAESAIRDDKAHIDYLKRDVLDDQKAGGKYKDINQTADEKHISKLAGDIKADGHFLSKHWSHNRSFSKPSVHEHEGGPEMFDHSWGGESVEMKDQGGDSPLNQGLWSDVKKFGRELVDHIKGGGGVTTDAMKPGTHSYVPETAPKTKEAGPKDE